VLEHASVMHMAASAAAVTIACNRVSPGSHTGTGMETSPSAHATSQPGPHSESVNSRYTTWPLNTERHQSCRGCHASTHANDMSHSTMATHAFLQACFMTKHSTDTKEVLPSHSCTLCGR
jgi:hypothetical protein